MTPEEKTKLDEAIEQVQGFNHYVRLGKTHHVEADYCDAVDLIITAVETLGAENERLRAKYAANLIAETKALREHCDYLEGELTKSKEWAEARIKLEDGEWYGDVDTVRIK